MSESKYMVAEFGNNPPLPWINCCQNQLDQHGQRVHCPWFLQSDPRLTHSSGIPSACFIVYAFSVKSTERKIVSNMFGHRPMPPLQSAWMSVCWFLTSLWLLLESSLSPPPQQQSWKPFHKGQHILNFSLPCAPLFTAASPLGWGPILYPTYVNITLTHLSTVDSMKCTWWQLGFVLFYVTVILFEGNLELLKVGRWARQAGMVFDP